MTHADPRVGVVACFHETNSFARQVTDRDAFLRRDGWLRGDRLFEAFAGTQTVVGGMLTGAAERLDLVPIFGAYATPAGVVTASAFTEIVEEIVGGLQDGGPLDGLLVELHGAMVVEDEVDPETRLLTAIREVVGSIPIAVVTDLHANVTAARVDLVDVVVGYRTNPHVDTFERGADAARHLHRIVTRPLRTAVVHRRVPVVAPPIAQGTADPPLLRLLETARALERRHGLIDVTVHGGYAYADVPHAGVSFTVTAPSDRRGAAEHALDLLVEQAWTDRASFVVDLPDAVTAVQRARERSRIEGGAIAIADTGDNINGGGPGDSTWLLHATLDPPFVPVAATLWDPAAVTAACAAGIGNTFRAELGGKAETLSGTPLRTEVTVRWVGDGTFTNTGPMSSGARVSMGQAAVVTVHGVADVILQSLPVQPNDPEMFRRCGLDPGSYAVVLLKGAAAVRAGWAPVVAGFVDAGTPGVTDCDLRRLPYRHLVDVWPLNTSETPRKAPS